MTEEQLIELHQLLVKAVVSVKELGVQDETGVIFLFPSDMMLKGLGEEIVVEAFIRECSQYNYNAQKDLLAALGNMVRYKFPKAFIQCVVRPFAPERGECWIFPG